MAIVYHKKINEDTEFAIWKIDESADELYAQLQLRDHEEKLLDGLNNSKRNLHWLSTRALLRELLNTPHYIDCQIDEHGKPYLPDSPYHISFSHSFDYAAVIISRHKPVGIDIEVIREKIERIANKFLIEKEIAFINNSDRVEHLYACWCAKEAIYKLHGKRNVSFKDNIRLQPFDYKGKKSFEASLETEQEHKTFKVHFEKFENYMIAYVAGCNETKHKHETAISSGVNEK